MNIYISYDFSAHKSTSLALNALVEVNFFVRLKRANGMENGNELECESSDPFYYFHKSSTLKPSSLFVFNHLRFQPASAVSRSKTIERVNKCWMNNDGNLKLDIPLNIANDRLTMNGLLLNSEPFIKIRDERLQPQSNRA